MTKEEILNDLLKNLLEKNLAKLEKRNNDEIKDIKLMKLFFTKEQCLIQSFKDDIKRRTMTRIKTSENLRPGKRTPRLYTPSNKPRVSKSKDKSFLKEKESFSNLNKAKIDGVYKTKNEQTKNELTKKNNLTKVNNEKKNYKTPLRKMHSQINSLSKLKKHKKTNNNNINNKGPKTPLNFTNNNIKSNEIITNRINRKSRLELLDSINRANKSFISNNKNNLNKSNNNLSNYNDKNKHNTSNKKTKKIKINNKPKANLFLEQFDKNKLLKGKTYKNFGEFISCNDGKDTLILISNFIDNKTKYNLFSCQKNYIKHLYQYIDDKYTLFKEKNKINSTNEKINTLQNDNSLNDLDLINNNKFNLSIGTLKAIELLNNKEHLKFFDINNYNSFSDDIYLVYKIIFQLGKNNALKNSENKKKFFEGMIKYIKDNIKEDKIGDLFKDLVNNFDFSKENIFQIKNIIKGNEEKLKPKFYSQICATTGLIIFLVKDILEFLGFNNNNNKYSPSIILANLEFIEKMNAKIPNYLKTLEKYIQK